MLRRTGQRMHDKSSHDADITKLGKGPVSIAFGLERIGLIAVQAPIVSCLILLALVIGAIFGIQRIKVDDSLSQLFRSDSTEYQAVRGGDEALPVQRVRRAGGGRGQDPAGARQPRKAARPRHRPAAGRRHARPDLAVLGAAAAGARQAAGGAVSQRTARGRGLRQVHPDGEAATRSSAASCCPTTARWRWWCCRSIPPWSATTS